MFANSSSCDDRGSGRLKVRSGVYMGSSSTTMGFSGARAPSSSLDAMVVSGVAAAVPKFSEIGHLTGNTSNITIYNQRSSNDDPSQINEN